MKWLLGAAAFLILGLAFKLGLLVYGMYVLLGVLLVSRYLAWAWTGQLSATRCCDRESAQIGESARIEVTVYNLGRLRVPWLLIEDSLPLEALREHPPRLQVSDEPLSLEARCRPGEKRPCAMRRDSSCGATTSLDRCCWRAEICSVCIGTTASLPRRAASWSIPKLSRWKVTISPRGVR